MNIQFSNTSIQNSKADAILIDMFEGTSALSGETAEINQKLGNAIHDLILDNDFRGKLNEVYVLYTRGALPARRVILLGLGKIGDVTPDRIRQAAAIGAKKARELGCKSIASIALGSEVENIEFSVKAQSTVEGIILGLYRWQKNQTSPVDRADIESVTVCERDPDLIAGVEVGTHAGQSIASGVCLARDLVNQAPNYLTPIGLSIAAEKMAQDAGISCIVHDQKWMVEQRMAALLSVAQGSENPPVFIELEYKGTDDAPLVFVGKGITFDSGGISLKPSANMKEMSSDMGGAAAVIGAIKAIAKMKLPIHVVGLIAACENLPSGSAYRPADVIKTRNGKTVEIITTDAEGRMTLADALDYAAEFKPQAVIDLATLTGACIIALGENVAAGYFSNDEHLAEQVEEAGRSSGEKLWRMPLFDEYRDKIKSNYADLKNAGEQYGGVGTSAMFLKEFTSYPWTHWDIAGMVLDTIGPTPHYPFTHPPQNVFGATGYGVRALVSLARDWKSITP